MNKLDIYLAGHSLEVKYRDYAKEKYGDQLNLIDPMFENGAIINVEKKTVELTKPIPEIVENDKVLISKSHIVVVYIRKITFGSTMEILHAYNCNVPVYVILHPDAEHFRNDVWLYYHTTKFFNSIDECFYHILEGLKSE